MCTHTKNYWYRREAPWRALALPICTLFFQSWRNHMPSNSTYPASPDEMWDVMCVTSRPSWWSLPMLPPVNWNGKEISQSMPGALRWWWHSLSLPSSLSLWSLDFVLQKLPWTRRQLSFTVTHWSLLLSYAGHQQVNGKRDQTDHWSHPHHFHSFMPQTDFVTVCSMPLFLSVVDPK